MEEDEQILKFISEEKIEIKGVSVGTQFRLLRRIENLINKYKEQERDIRDSHIVLAKYSQKVEEQEKVIELMAEYIDFDKMNFNCSSLCVKEGCREECIIDYFRKKAKGE